MSAAPPRLWQKEILKHISYETDTYDDDGGGDGRRCGGARNEQATDDAADSCCVKQQEMEKLLNDIIKSATPSEKRPIYDRRKWNRRIHNLCYDKMMDAVTREDSICVMYGCPEVLFSPKKKAEKRLREKGEDFDAE